jgi:hypothetical protein
VVNAVVSFFLLIPVVFLGIFILEIFFISIFDCHSILTESFLLKEHNDVLDNFVHLVHINCWSEVLSQFAHVFKHSLDYFLVLFLIKYAEVVGKDYAVEKVHHTFWKRGLTSWALMPVKLVISVDATVEFHLAVNDLEVGH